MAPKTSHTCLFFAGILAIMAACLSASRETLPEDGTILNNDTLARVTGLNPSYDVEGATLRCSLSNGGSPGSPPVAEYYCPSSPVNTSCIACYNPDAQSAMSSDGSSEPDTNVEPAGSTPACSIFEKWQGKCTTSGCTRLVRLQTCGGTYPEYQFQQ